MHVNKKNTAIVKRKFKNFCKHCNLSGFYYFSENHHWIVHCSWCIVIILSAMLCIFLSSMIWQKFAVNPTFTVVESTRYASALIPFPAVTVCDSEAVYGPNIDNISLILQRRGFDLMQIDKFFASIGNVKQANYTYEDYIPKMHSLLTELGINLDSLMLMLAKPCEVLLVSCIWRSQQIPCSAMFRQVSTIAGYCCQFDIEYFRKQTVTAIQFKSGVETSEALEFTLDGNNVQRIGAVTQGSVLLYIFDAKNFITLEDSYVMVSSAGLFDVNIYVWAIDSTKEVKALDIASRKCIINTDENASSFYNECISNLMLKVVVQACRCIPFNFIAEELNEEDYLPCTWDRLVCVYQTLAKAKSELRDQLAQDTCLQQCDYVQYETEIEYIRQRRFYGNANESHSKVFVHFASHTCIKYRREVLYTWDEMLANLGGIFGLCLGGSIITIVELFWFLFDLIYTLTARRKKTSPQKTDKSIYTLSQRVKRKKKSIKYPFLN